MRKPSFYEEVIYSFVYKSSFNISLRGWECNKQLVSYKILVVQRNYHTIINEGINRT